MARKVLIADDSPTVQKKASGVLIGEGMEVVTVSNGVAAIKKLPTVLPMVILADIAMPGKDGYEVCEFVKGSKEYANVPVILVFSDDDVLDEPKAARLRADGRIRKPFDRDELISTVNKYLAIAEAAAAKPVPPPVVKAPPPPTFVSEPMDEEPVVATKEDAPDFAAFGGGIAFAEPALEEIQAEPAEPSQSFESASTFEATPVIEPEPQAVEAPIIETEPPPAASTEFVAEMPAPQAAEPMEIPEIEATVEPPVVVEPPVIEEPPAAADPVFIEEPSAPEHAGEHQHPHVSEAERTIMFRAPADIAQPVLSDELSPAPAQEEPAPVQASSEVSSITETGEYEAAAPVPATTLESFSLSDAAAGNVRLTPRTGEAELPAAEPEPLAPEEPPAVEATPAPEAPAAEVPTAEPVPAPQAEAPQTLDPSQVYSIVYLVVAKMSPRLPPQAIEEIAKPLAKEISTELSAPSSHKN